MTEPLEKLLREFLTTGEWQTFTVDVAKIDVTTLGGSPAFMPTGFVDITVRLWVSPSTIPAEIVTTPDTGDE